MNEPIHQPVNQPVAQMPAPFAQPLFCSRCHAEIRETDNYCHACGKSLKRHATELPSDGLCRALMRS